MTTMIRHTEEIEGLREYLMRRWITWGILPMCICGIVAIAALMWGPPGIIEGKQQTRLAFEIVLGAGAAVFLAGFYIDGHWTSADRLGKRIFTAAGGEPDDESPRDWAKYRSHRSALRSNAHIALDSIRASADAITLMGTAIGPVAIVTVLVGLPGEHVAQMLLLGLFYQLFVYSRHPYYIRLAEAALSGELLPREDEKETDEEQ
ncbi:MAG: hypothetical protein U9R79_15935 [Armatimonadota bacterium]|nr:hypothetical protein [Armatimonadota bacterium]